MDFTPGSLKDDNTKTLRFPAFWVGSGAPNGVFDWMGLVFLFVKISLLKQSGEPFSKKENLANTFREETCNRSSLQSSVANCKLYFWVKRPFYPEGAFVMPMTAVQLDAIEPAKLYPRLVFLRKLNISEATLRSARRRGLQTYRVHGRTYVLGRDWIAYVTGQITSPPQSVKASDPMQADSPARMKG